MNTLDFYTMEQCTKIFNAIENPQWRIWKVIDHDKQCRQNKSLISTPKKLYDLIHLCKNPKAVYVGISEFLNPHKNKGFLANQQEIINGRYVHPCAGHLYADSIILSSYFFVDIDNETELGQEEGRKIHTELKKNKALKLHSIQLSGSINHHHLLYKVKSKLLKDPIQRIRYIIEEKRKIVESLKQLNLKTIDTIHEHIMCNPFAVYAAPYSTKSNGNIVTPIKEKEFMINSFADNLSSCRSPSATEGKPNDCKVANGALASQPYVTEKGGGLTFSPIYYKFIDNKIKGLLGNYVTVIKTHIKRFKIERLKQLQERYKLSDFLILKNGNYIFSLNFKRQDFERELKILRAARSENLRFFITRGHLPIQYTASIYENGDLATELEYIGTLRSDYGLNDQHSRPHSNLFNFQCNNLVGNESNTIGTMKVS